MQALSIVVCCLVILLDVGVAHAVSAAQKCESAKLKLAAKYGACRLRAEAAAVRNGAPPDFSKCDAKLAAKWMQAEQEGGGTCPTSGDSAEQQGFITDHTAAVASALSGGSLPDYAGQLAACQAEPRGRPLKTGQVSCYDEFGNPISCAGSGHDGEQQHGVTRSYTNNGDGTITDHSTGLMWEVKSADNSLHAYWRLYTWPSAQTHAAILNGISFAGHRDWRLPTINELVTLVHFEQLAFDPSDPAFNSNCVAGCSITECSCSIGLVYWSSTTDIHTPNYAWGVYFNTHGSLLDSNQKILNAYARAVRSVQ